jgi:hypothetical protein
VSVVPWAAFSTGLGVRAGNYAYLRGVLDKDHDYEAELTADIAGSWILNSYKNPDLEQRVNTYFNDYLDEILVVMEGSRQ